MQSLPELEAPARSSTLVGFMLRHENSTSSDDPMSSKEAKKRLKKERKREKKERKHEKKSKRERKRTERDDDDDGGDGSDREAASHLGDGGGGHVPSPDAVSREDAAQAAKEDAVSREASRVAAEEARLLMPPPPPLSADAPPAKKKKTNRADFFASLSAAEADKPPIGTFHATGKFKDADGNEIDDDRSGDWACQKCNYVNFKECMTCARCRSLRRFEGRNQASGYCQ